jgi:hypothetical protein
MARGILFGTLDRTFLMIKEIAVDPDLMAEWEWFLKIYLDTGLDHGLLIATFPRKWKRKVTKRAWELVSEGVNQDIKVQSLILRMNDPSFDARLLECRREYGIVEGTWLERALAQEDPFDAILARRSHPSMAYIRAEDEYFEDERFKVARQIRVARNAEALVRPCRRLISGAASLKVIEPYFDPTWGLKWRPFQRLLEEIAIGPCAVTEVELHTVRSANFSKATRDNYERILSKIIPPNLTVLVLFWAQKPDGENLHPRFVLTDQGGLKYDYGFDESENPGETTIVDLISPQLHSQIWAEYDKEGNAFDINPSEHVIRISCSQN